MQYPIARHLVLLCLAASALGPHCRAGEGAGEIHVAPGGSDGNPGTAAAPLATIGAARDAARRVIASGLTSGLRVILHDGTYWLTQPLVLGPEDSGTDDFPVTYAAAPGARPRISGGARITGWRDAGDGRWTAALPDAGNGRWSFRELFVNGARRPRARHPNSGFLRVAAAVPDRRGGFTFNEGDIPPSATAPGTELVFLHDWSISRIPVAAIDHQQRILTAAHPIGPRAAHYAIDNFEPNPRYFLENAPAFLDAPGEWYLDERAGLISYRPMPGETPGDIEAIAPVVTALLVARGDDDRRPVRSLHFDGLAFEHCAWAIPQRGYAAGQAGFHERRDGSGGDEIRQPMPAAVTFELARDCHFRDGRIAHVGGAGIRFASRCHDCSLSRSVVTDIGGTGVMIGEDRSRAVAGRPWTESAPEQVARGNAVEECTIERCGQLFFGGVGVWVGLAAETSVARNEIREQPYTGVSVGWMWNPTPTPCAANRIELNHIHHVMQILSDGGGIYTLGRQPGTVLRGNRIHDVPLNAGRAESNGMFLDEGTTGLVIEENVIYAIDRSPLRFHRAEENVVRNNTLVVGEGIPPVRYNSTDAAKITLEHNRIVPASEWTP